MSGEADAADFGVERGDHTLRTTGRKVVNSITFHQGGLKVSSTATSTLVIAYPGHFLFPSSMSDGNKAGTHANKLFARLN